MSNRSRHMTPRLDYRDALRLMFKPGHKLTQTNGRARRGILRGAGWPGHGCDRQKNSRPQSLPQR